ncbi:hypothetical protein ACQEU3_41190 [Spirillospora sp. CA-253888]
MRRLRRLVYDSEGRPRRRTSPPLSDAVAVAGAGAVALGVLLILGQAFWWTTETLMLSPFLISPGLVLITAWAMRRNS